MKIKHRVIFFLLIVILIGIICSGCFKEDEEVVDNSNEMSLQNDSRAMIEDDEEVLESMKDDKEEVDKDIEKNNSEETEDEDSIVEAEDSLVEAVDNNSSPWEFLFESSVETKVEYAGFLNESIGVTVGYAGEISYTEDGGDSWAISDNSSACRYGLDIYDESFIVSSGNSGVNLLSNDKGKSWTKLTDFPLKRSGEYNKFISVIDTNNLYIASKISLGVSNDGGVTWEELALADGCDSIVGMFFMTPENGYILNSDGTLYITKDSCKSWTTQVLDLQGEKIIMSKMPSAAINFQSEDEGMIIYSTTSYKVYCIKTENGGNTWETVDMPKVYYFAPYISRDGRYLTLSSSLKKLCLYRLDSE